MDVLQPAPPLTSLAPFPIPVSSLHAPPHEAAGRPATDHGLRMVRLTACVPWLLGRLLVGDPGFLERSVVAGALRCGPTRERTEEKDQVVRYTPSVKGKTYIQSQMIPYAVRAC